MLDIKQNDNDTTMLRITRRAGEAFFIDDVCVRVDAINFKAAYLLIDEKYATAEYHKPLNVLKNVDIVLSKNTSKQLKVEIFAPRSVLIVREEIAHFDENHKLMRIAK